MEKSGGLDESLRENEERQTRVLSYADLVTPVKSVRKRRLGPHSGKKASLSSGSKPMSMSMASGKDKDRTARLEAKLAKLERENERLRTSARRWKRRHEQETQVNKELARRAKEWRNRSRALQRDLDAQAKLLTLVTPVSTLASPEGGGMFGIAEGSEEMVNMELSEASLSLAGASPSPSLSTSLRLEGLSPDCGPGPEANSPATPLFSHMIIVGPDEEIQQCWPPDARDSVPPNVAHFCFPSRSIKFGCSGVPFAERVFVFMLSGDFSGGRGCSPVKSAADFSCIDGATFGVCCLAQDGTCICLLSREPLFEVFSQLLEALTQVQPAVRATLLESFTEYARGLPVGPGLELETLHVRWVWPEDCKHRLDLLSRWGLKRLLGCLPLDNVLFIVGCLLLELKVVLVSADLHRLSAAVLGLLPLLRPCQWVQPFIPLLPPNLSIVCEAPVPVFVGTAEVPLGLRPDDSDDDDDDFGDDAALGGVVGANVAPPTQAQAQAQARARAQAQTRSHDSGRQEAVVVLLDKGEMELSSALATSYHALKFPGLSEVFHAVRAEADTVEATEDVLPSVLHEHISSLLGACRYFGQATATLAAASSLSNTAMEDAETKLASLVPLLGSAVSVSSPWQYLARLQTTQMYMQWSEKASAEPAPDRFHLSELTSLLSPAGNFSASAYSSKA